MYEETKCSVMFSDGIIKEDYPLKCSLPEAKQKINSCNESDSHHFYVEF